MLQDVTASQNLIEQDFLDAIDLRTNNEISSSDRSRIQQMSQLSCDALLQFHNLLRITHIHDFQNEASQQVAEKLLATFQKLISYDFEIKIECIELDFLVNERWTKLSRQYRPIFLQLKEIFDSLQLRTLWISKVPNMRQLERFVLCFHNDDSFSEGDTFSLFQTRLWKHHIDWLTVERQEEDSEYQDQVLEPSAFIRQLYFYAIQVSQKLHTQAEAGVPLKLTSAKRIVQAVVDVFLNPRSRYDTTYLMMLTQIKNCVSYQYNHAVNVMILSIGLGQFLGLKRGTLRDLGIASLLVDIGLAKLPKDLVNSSDLTSRQREQLQKHTALGVPVILNTLYLDSSIIRSSISAFAHHLGPVGGGYPSYGEGHTTLFSQIIAITDQYDALTTARPHRPGAKTPPEALGIMASKLGRMLNQILVRRFIDWIHPFPVGTILFLSNQFVGYVIAPSETFRERPIIKLISPINPQGASFVNLAERSHDGEFVYEISNILNHQDKRLQQIMLKEILEWNSSHLAF